MNDEIWKMIDERFNPRSQANACRVDGAEFSVAMAPFEQQIDSDYREFVLRYGGGLVGPNLIYGLRKAEWMGTIGGMATAPQLTQLFRKKKWPGAEEWLIFSIDQGGNPIGFAKDRTVWLSDQLDFRQVLQIASGFEDYLLKWCLRT